MRDSTVQISDILIFGNERVYFLEMRDSTVRKWMILVFGNERV